MSQVSSVGGRVVLCRKGTGKIKKILEIGRRILLNSLLNFTPRGCTPGGGEVSVSSSGREDSLDNYKA